MGSVDGCVVMGHREDYCEEDRGGRLLQGRSGRPFPGKWCGPDVYFEKDLGGVLCPPRTPRPHAYPCPPMVTLGGLC